MKKNKKILIKWVAIIIFTLVCVFLFLQAQSLKKQNLVKTHVSQDLKISFKYPKDWFIQDKDFRMYITSYYTNHKDGLKPNKDQTEIHISNFYGCHETIEENLKDPACGEGGPSVKPNSILSKETTPTQSGTFYKYVIQYPNGQQQKFYLLQQTGADRILQISKEPDPSKFEKEFEDIVKSIKFL